jgi:hypothetical protein
LRDLPEFVRCIVTVLDDLSVTWMFVGSMASTMHGPPRSTQDVDLVVSLTPADVSRLIAAFPADNWYLSPEAVRDAVMHRSSFSIIDMESGWKADLMLSKSRPFSRSELDRRQRAEVLGVPAWVATVEDTVLSKLEWSRLAGGSSRQQEDVAGVLEAQWNLLDMDYLQTWAKPLQVADALRDVLAMVRQRRAARG